MSGNDQISLRTEIHWFGMVYCSLHNLRNYSRIALDRVSGLSPLFMIAGVLLGSVAAFWGLFKMVKQFIKQ